ncbi:MAG: hypothetical protein U9N50_06145 [Pseudomonadota bacterium]|nr:hypothetical protein [Pseudomonadota bacterium]
MTETVTCTYDSADKARNAREDLIATGIPQEKIFFDEETNQIKVMIPASTKPEVVEILNRHNPTLN